MKILLLDSEAGSRIQTAEKFRSVSGTELLTAESGADAMDILAQPETPVGLVICNLDAPDSDALNFICKVGKAYPGISMAVLSDRGAAVLGSAERLCGSYGINVISAIEKPVSEAAVQRLIDFIEGGSMSATESSLNLDDLDILRGLRGYQFDASYQPIVSLASDEVKGVEALARWFHPELGAISPAVFIKELEASGNIGELTSIMASQAAAACARWRQRDIDATVSVNLSVAALKKPGFTKVLLEAVRDNGLEPEFLIFELTDTAQLHEDGDEIRSLQHLHGYGFGLSISDFSDAMSGREQLLQGPVTELKINRLLVADMLTDEDARNKVDSIIAKARELGITSVAEGVETQAAWDYLQVAGCHQAQGYFISKPVSETELVVFCKDRMPL